MINDEPGHTNGKTSVSQMSPGTVYSTKIVASVFGGIVVNAHWQRAFVIVIVAYPLEQGWRTFMDQRATFS
ncbi:hypothetical protein TNCV_2952571 [Trichonephila clavipes]|nr:hypothetical protein TNCV_2952571 [Trichonephila clavipes]